MTPLMPGIAIMALGAMEKYNFLRHRTGSKIVMEFGPAYEVPQEMVDLYRRDKRKAIEALLSEVEKVRRAQLR
jgi:hypothetical protein